MNITDLASALARCLLVVGVGMALGCSATQPWEAPIDPALDLSTVPNAKDIKSAPAAVLVMMPVRNLSGENWQSVAEVYSSALKSKIIGSANVTLRAEGQELDGVIAQLGKGGMPLYNPERAVEVGKLTAAQFVGYVTVTEVVVSTSPVLTTEVRHGQSYTMTKYNVSAQITADLAIVSVQTGKVVHSKGDAGNLSLSYVEHKPSQGAMVTLASDAARTLGESLARGLGNVFPTDGYIAELRGGQSFALVKVDGARLDAGATLRVMNTRTHDDPVAGLRMVEEPIGELVVHSVSPSGVWCRVRAGKPKLQLGMKVTTGGGPSR